MKSLKHTHRGGEKSTREIVPLLRAGSLPHIGFLALTAIACVGAFIGLDFDSLWLDELFTAHFSDPAQSSLMAVVLRGAEDIHPPLYYLLVYVARHLGGDYTLAVRGLSAVLGVASIAVLYMTARRELSPSARAFACAFASTSWGWWWYVQEARSYSLSFFLGTIMVALALRLQRRLNQGQSGSKTLVALVLVCLLGSFVHYYMLLLAGGLFGYFLFTVHGWRNRAVITIAGLTVVVPVASYVMWQVPHIYIDVGDTWFLTTLKFTVIQFSVGFAAVFGSFGGLVVLITASVFVGMQTLRTGGRAAIIAAARAPIGLTVLVPALTLALALVVTWVAVPMFSHRLFVIVAPFVWVFSGFMFERLVPLLRVPVLGVGLMFLALLSSHERLAYRFEPKKEEWRNSAAHIQSQTACQGAVLPVVVQGTMTAINARSEHVFYEYYLRDETGASEYKLLPLNSLLKVRGAWQDLMRARAQDPQACPVLLWSISVNKGDEKRVRKTAKHLSETLDLAPGRSIEVVEFSQLARPPLAPPLLGQPRALTWGLIIQIRDTPERP